MKIDANLFNYWPEYRLMAYSAFEGSTRYEGLVARTATAPLGIEVVYPERVLLRFTREKARGGTQSGDVLFGSDFFLCGPEGERSRGVVVDANHLLIAGEGIELEGALPPSLEILEEGGRMLVGVKACFQPELIRADLDAALASRRAWVEKFSKAQPSTPAQARTLFTALAIMKSQVCSAEGKLRHRWSTPDRWPHRNMWLWDTTFHAMGLRHLDQAVARETFEAVFDLQREDGFVPLSGSPVGVESVFTQPPVLAFGVRKLYEDEPDREWLERLYPKLCAYIRWDMKHRDEDGGGLYEWAMEQSPICRSGESGMDNSPRFDADTRWDAVDLNACLALECESLAALATALGKTDDAEAWQQEHARLCRLINERLWSDEAGFYCDCDIATGEHSKVLASAGFLPLLCGAVPPERMKSLLVHLHSPETFGTAFPVPSVAAAGGDFYSPDMWRGPTWININWLIAEGLKRSGEHDEAARLLRKTMGEIERWCEAHSSIFEYYDDRGERSPLELLRKRKCEPEVSPYFQVMCDYGWSACLYVDALIGHSSDALKEPSRS